MGGNVADFVVVQDNSFDLSSAAGGDIDRNFGPFTLPGDTIVSQSSILSFMVKGNATLNARINDKVVFGPTQLGSEGADVVRCFQEACQRDILKNGAGNKVEFKVTAGSCSISDVVLWFQNAT